MSDATLSRRRMLALSGAAALSAGCAPTVPPRARCIERPSEIFPSTSGAPPQPLPGFPATRGHVWAWDEVPIHSVDATIHRPKSEAELRGMIRAAHDAGRPVTLRAGGQSLGEQALGKTIIMLDDPAFQSVSPVFFEGGEPLVTCGAGTRWGHVVRTLGSRGYVPRSVVTTGDATVGGTAAVDGLSRMSPVVGKEGAQIKRFKLIDGRGSAPITVERGKSAHDDAVFDAAIAGFGAIGVMTEVTFKVAVAIEGYSRRPSVKTRATRYMPGTYDWESLLLAIARDSEERCRRYGMCRDVAARNLASEPSSRGERAFGYSAVSWFSGEGLALSVLEHSYVEDNIAGKRVPGDLYVEDSAFARFAERVAGYSSTLSQAISTFAFPNGEYIDELCGFLFNLGNSATPAKQDIRRRGSRLNFVQQTFVVPTPRKPGTMDYDVGMTRHFLYLVLARCREREVRPVTMDLLHLKADTAYLSANRNMTGFGITLTFADHDEREWPFIQETLMALSHDLRELGGRVHLVKNVEADPADLRAMYEDGLREFAKVKAELDPKGVLTNRFYDRYFGAGATK